MRTYNEIKAAAESQGGEAWIEELLVRGRPGGKIGGGHAIVGVRVPGPDGELRVGTLGPFPVSTAADDPAFAAIVETLNKAAIETATEAEAAVAEKDAAIASLTAERDAAAAALATVTAERDLLGGPELAAQREKEAKLDAAHKAKADAEAAIAELTKAEEPA